MALLFCSEKKDPNYIALSTDITNGKIAGTQPGRTVFLSDTKAWKIIKSDLSLGDYSLAPTSDFGAGWTSAFGVSGAAVVSADIQTATVVTDPPTSGQKLVITDIIVSSDTAMNILFEEETSGADIFKFFISGNAIAQLTPRGKIKLATANKRLTAKGSAAGNVGITVCYYSEP